MPKKNSEEGAQLKLQSFKIVIKKRSSSAVFFRKSSLLYSNVYKLIESDIKKWSKKQVKLRTQLIKKKPIERKYNCVE